MSDKTSFAAASSRSEGSSGGGGKPQSESKAAAETAGPIIGTPEFSARVLHELTGGAGTSAIIPTGGFVAAVTLMLERPFAPHSIATLADAVGMNRNVFERQFTARFGVGPMAYLERERLRAAAHLLRTTNVAISVIARRVGFPNRSDFSRAFGDRYAMSPSALRERP